jgi:hypothetical protein
MSPGDTATPQSIHPRRRFCRGIVLAACLLFAYCGSFFICRQWHLTTYLDDDLSMRTLRLYYFSRDESRNRVLFWFYYPVHNWLLQADSTLTVSSTAAAYEAARRRATVYIEDITLLNPR